VNKLKIGSMVGMMKVVDFKNGNPVFKTTNPETIKMMENMTKPELRKGISQRGNSLQVVTRKRIEGQQRPLIISGSIKIAEYDTLDEAVKEAEKLKDLQEKEISTTGFNNTLKKKIRTVGILGEVMPEVIEEKEAEGKDTTNQTSYMKDILEYFPRDIRLDAMQTQDHYKNFKKKIKEVILHRVRNHKKTYNSRSLNKRLGFLRDTFRFAITNKLLHVDKLLDTGRVSSDMGWKDDAVIESKGKNIISPQVEQEIVDEAIFDGEQEFVDAFRWLLNGYGMRLEFEFQKFTVDNITFPRGKDKKFTINFFRNKTKKWSGELPMNEVTKEIALRYRERAFARADKKLFPNMTKRKLRTLFDRYTKRLGLVGDKKITPYCTKHTFITRLAENKVPVKTISILAGITVETALGYYNQVTDEGMVEAMQSLENDSSKVVSMIGHNRKMLNK
tara:strand:+ start:774 stop:2111 length:1338 start_codon:yes stop_codon:yes gene_type:complete